MIITDNVYQERQMVLFCLGLYLPESITTCRRQQQAGLVGKFERSRSQGGERSAERKGAREGRKGPGESRKWNGTENRGIEHGGLWIALGSLALTHRTAGSPWLLLPERLGQAGRTNSWASRRNLRNGLMNHEERQHAANIEGCQSDEM